MNSSKVNKVILANHYAKMLLIGIDRKLLISAFGEKFCEIMNSVILFELLDSDKTFSDIEKIKFYECQSGRGSKALISKIKFK